jgi:hypothetical protein
MSDYAISEIRRLVWSGFYDADEVQEILLDEIFQPGELDDAWAAGAIKAEFMRKKEVEGAWPLMTDCDRLDSAFDELNGSGIIALQNAGYDQDQGLEDVTDAYHEQGGADSRVEGYCFYHGQDLERAVDGEGLLLTFGDIQGDDERGIDIGHRIVETLARHGLAVSWSGTIAERIELPEIEWRRRYRA